MEAISEVQIFGFISIFQLLLVIHIIGLGFGFGGAIASDFMFIHALRDWKINQTEFGFLKLASRIVWTGVILLALSGIGMFLFSPSSFISSPKFMAKMTIVGILVINGFIFHYKHIPLIGKNTDKDLPSAKEFVSKSRALFISGAISMVSWFSALVLGALRSVPLSYISIMLIYGGVLAFAILVAMAVCSKVFPLNPKR